nr:uncharacterized protein LOC109173786 [Ipomoea trifida]
MPSRTASLIRSIAQLLSQLHQGLTRRIASAPLVYNRLHLVHGLAYFVAQVRAKAARLELRTCRVAPAYSNRVAPNHLDHALRFSQWHGYVHTAPCLLTTNLHSTQHTLLFGVISILVDPPKHEGGRLTNPLTNSHAEAISAEFYDYHFFKTPKDYATTNQQEPRYDSEKKYIPGTKIVAVAMPSREKAPTSGDIGLIKCSRQTLGMKKASASEGWALVPTGLPLTSVLPVSSGSDFQATQAYIKRVKDKVIEVKEDQPKCGRELCSFLRGGEDPTTLMDKLFDFLMELEITRGWSINKLGENATCQTMVGLFFQVKAVERLYERELEATKQSLARRKAKIWDLEKKVKVAEQKVKTTVADYKASSALIVEALAWTEQLTGKIYTKVREALAESLDDDDL